MDIYKATNTDKIRETIVWITKAVDLAEELNKIKLNRDMEANEDPIKILNHWRSIEEDDRTTKEIIECAIYMLNAYHVYRKKN